jgi:hypothetical protein
LGNFPRIKFILAIFKKKPEECVVSPGKSKYCRE